MSESILGIQLAVVVHAGQLMGDCGAFVEDRRGELDFDSGTRLNYVVDFSDDLDAIMGGKIQKEDSFFGAGTEALPIAPRLATGAAIFPSA